MRPRTVNSSLRAQLSSPQVSYAMEAHNGISAKIAEEAGFKILWASGLTISASLGHRDNNEISWSAFLNQVEYIVDSVRHPVLVDGDTGFGNFNNVRQFIKKLCKCKAAGVCLEDKLFPKTNSFLPYNQVLAPIDEFVGKIKAAKDSQLDDDFCLIARTEALIAGQGVREAIKRATAYRKAGADAILIHSKMNTPKEIEEFCSIWDYSAPLVLVPTKYAPSSPQLYESLKISLVIWGNHLMRAAIYAMRKTAQSIYKKRSLDEIDSSIASLEDLFRLVDEEELRRAALKYLPQT